MSPFTRHFVLAVAFAVAAALAAPAGDNAPARAIVDKAIAAHGGEAQLAKWNAVTARLKGTFHGLGDGVTFTGEIATHGRDRQKVVMEGELDGEKFRIVHVLNGDKGWVNIAGATEEMDADDLAEAREEAYAEWIATLTPLKDKAFTLLPVGEITIDKRPAAGIRVSSKGHRDVTLYFDKKTSLLVKTEARVKDESGEEVTEETFMREYKAVQGTQQAMKLTVKRDGKAYLEAEVTEYRLLEKLDDSVFTRP